MKQKTFQNPLKSGFYPDPSICRVGDDYYMVTSSFVYFPGLPIFHSKDLVHWEQIGHGIHSPEQLDYKNCETSLGLWAPSIRYHDGTFYIINTFISEGREARRDNYIITAKDPAGPWSKACFVEGADGIDSSLFFDDDGRMYYAGNYIVSDPVYEGHHGIYLCELDPETFQFKGERTVIWNGLKNGSRVLTLTEVKNHVRTVLAETPLEKDGRIYLTVAATPEGYHFYYGYSDQEFRLLCKNVDPTLLSSLVNEGFTGAYIGMYATSNHSPVKNHADFDWVLYEAE